MYVCYWWMLTYLIVKELNMCYTGYAASSLLTLFLFVLMNVDTEVQHITLEKCFLTDELFATLISEFKNLRHLKSLVAPYNMLTSASVSLLIESYGSSSRRIEVLDLRDNVGITEDDGRRLFVVFSPIIKTLNGIDIFEIKRAREPVLNLSSLRLKAPEMNIVIGLWGLLGNTVVELNLSKNLFDHKALVLFANYLKTAKRVTTIDLSFNPLTGLQGNSMSGIKALVATIRATSHLESVNLTATRVPVESVQAINRSLEVNRTLPIASKPLFLQHANALIRKAASPPRVNHLADWKPKFAVDVVFSKINRIAERDVNVNTNDPNHDINLYLIQDTRKRNTDF